MPYMQKLLNSHSCNINLLMSSAQPLRDDFIPVESPNDVCCCKICLELALAPVECTKCENLFCMACASAWRDKQDKCPNKCNGGFEFKQAHRLVRSQIQQVKCYCGNRPYGCNEQMLFEQLLAHKSQCKFVPVRCVANCNWKGLQGDIEKHQLECAEIDYFNCPTCTVRVLKANKGMHNCFKELMEKFSQLQSEFQSYKSASEIKIAELSAKVVDVEKKQSSVISGSSRGPDSIIISQDKAVIPMQQVQQPQVARPSFIVAGQLCNPTPGLTCQRNHLLRFWISPGIHYSRQTCGKCSQKQLCRYVCEDCRAYFCLQCIPPRLTQRGEKDLNCPAGHQILQRGGGGFICDICSKDSSTMKKPDALQCRQCDFDICFECLHKYQLVKDQRCKLQ